MRDFFKDKIIVIIISSFLSLVLYICRKNNAIIFPILITEVVMVRYSGSVILLLVDKLIGEKKMTVRFEKMNGIYGLMTCRPMKVYYSWCVSDIDEKKVILFLFYQKHMTIGQVMNMSSIAGRYWL